MISGHLHVINKIIFLLLFCFISNQISAGAWPQPKRGSFVKLSEWWVVSDQHFDQNGQVVPNTHEFGYYSTNIYYEYGLSNRFTALANVSYLIYTYSVPPSMTGKIKAWTLVGDGDFGIKYGLIYQKPVSVSLSFLLSIPGGEGRGELEGGLQTGYGEWNQTMMIDAGSGFKISNANGWINLNTGYRVRGGGYNDEFLFGAEAGITMSNNKITIIARLAGIESLGESSLNINPQSLYSNGREYVSLSPEVLYHFDDEWGISAGIGTAFSGKNIFASTTFTIGLFRQIKQVKADAPAIN